ncbi:hypothetical protein D3C78_1285940 [compost metagenome]
MQNLIEIHLKPEVLARYGLLDIPYPMPLGDLQAALCQGGELPLAMLLQALQNTAPRAVPIGGSLSRRWIGWHSCWLRTMSVSSFRSWATTGGWRLGRWSWLASGYHPTR